MNNEPHIFFHEVNERQGAFHRRTFLLGGLAGAGLATLAGRLAALQLVESNRYQTLSASNQFNYRIIPPPRGRILDRNGVELAGNRPNFRLLLTRDATTKPEVVLQQISDYIPIDDARRRQVMRDLKNSPRYVPISLADDLTWEQFSRINVRSPELPGVTADMGEARVYPFGGAFAHVIGYVSRVSADDLKREGDNPDPVLLHPGFRIGKQGVEKSLDKQLRGKAGGQKVEVDSRGRVVRKDPKGDLAAIPGAEVVLTLDADIQNRALEVFGAESGAAVLMDVRNGDILCMTSAPSFDANQFVKGMDRASYQALATYERKPLLDKALSSTFPPGSTFKTIVALAALANGYDRRTVHVCNKVWSYGGRPWHCDQAHGAQDLKGAIATSCDVYFYQCALTVGPDKIAAMARKFGLGEIFDIGIPGQKAGLVPDLAFKRRFFPKDPVWHPGETPSMGIGQGYTHLNPLQICVQASRIANGQKSLHPRLIKSVGGVERPHGSDFGDLPVDREHLQFVRDAMAAVTGAGSVRIAHATAAAVSDLGLGPVKMAGKTGTAQAHTYAGGGTGARGAQGAWALRDHAWFMAFAPFDAPRYALSVLVEHGGWGASSAVPRAREIMRVALLKDPEIRARIMQSGSIEPPMSNEALKGATTAAPATGSGGADDVPVTAPGADLSRDHRDMIASALSRPGERERWTVKFADIDWVLCGLLCLIAGAGGLMLYSVAGSHWMPWAAPNLIRFGVFFVLMIVLALVDLRVWFGLAYPVYLIGLIMLVGVELAGDISLGAKRWLALGGLRFQPSEIMKLGVVLGLARFYHGISAHDAKLSWKLLIPAAMIGMPAVLVAHQPDLGTAILIAATGGAVMMLAGLSLRLIGGALLLIMAAVPPAFFFVLHPYQRERLTTFLHPETDPSGAGYHTLQAKIALGSGGLMGKGYGLGSQSQLNFLPEKQTDFIFATLAEEFGFLGCLSVLILYAGIIIIALRISTVAHSHFGRLSAAGVTATFAFYVLINGAMVMGLAPVVGVPMPLLSYGGTVMLSVMIGFGLVQCVRVHRYSEVTSGKGALL